MINNSIFSYFLTIKSFSLSHFSCFTVTMILVSQKGIILKYRQASKFTMSTFLNKNIMLIVSCTGI